MKFVGRIHVNPHTATKVGKIERGHCGKVEKNNTQRSRGMSPGHLYCIGQEKERRDERWRLDVLQNLNQPKFTCVKFLLSAEVNNLFE